MQTNGIGDPVSRSWSAATASMVITSPKGGGQKPPHQVLVPKPGSRPAPQHPACSDMVQPPLGPPKRLLGSLPRTVTDASSSRGHSSNTPLLSSWEEKATAKKELGKGVTEKDGGGGGDEN